MVAFGRLQSWSAGLQARVVAERAARESHPLAHNSLVGQVTDELVVTEPEAVEVVVQAESGNQHPSVVQALIWAGSTYARHTPCCAPQPSSPWPNAPKRSRSTSRRHPDGRGSGYSTRCSRSRRTGTAPPPPPRPRRPAAPCSWTGPSTTWAGYRLPARDRRRSSLGIVDDIAHQLQHTTGEDRTLSQLRADSLTGIITGRLLPADRFTDPKPGSLAAPAPDRRRVHRTRRPPAPLPSARRPTARTLRCARVAAGPRRASYGKRCGRYGSPRPTRRTRHSPSQYAPRPGQRARTPRGLGPIPAETARIIARTPPATTAHRPRHRDPPTTRPPPTSQARCYAPRSRPETTPAHSDGATPPPADATWTTSNPSTTNTRAEARARETHPDRPAHRTCNPCAASTTSSRPTPAGASSATPHTGITTWTTPTGRTHTRPPTVLDTHIDLDDIDPDTSHDLTLQALTGRHLPRQYATTEPGAIPGAPNDPGTATDADQPPF